MELSEWAGAMRGRQVALARHLHVKPPVVADWVSGKKPIPVKRAPAIEAFTGGAVGRQDMFPATWAVIWPELVEQEVVHV